LVIAALLALKWNVNVKTALNKLRITGTIGRRKCCGVHMYAATPRSQLHCNRCLFSRQPRRIALGGAIRLQFKLSLLAALHWNIYVRRYSQLNAVWLNRLTRGLV